MNLHFRTHSYIVGTCNGLVCLSYRDIIDGSRRSLIYNPTTKASRELPDYFFQSKFYSGFGYDPRSDDYKIVQVGFCGLSADDWQVAIFSLKSGCWRSIRAQPESHPADNCRGVYWGGALHWCVINWSGNNADGETLIMSFDLSEEKFRRMLPVPRAAGNMAFGNMAFVGEGAFAGLRVHRDGLFIYKGVRDHCFEGWITNEYGGRGGGSWTKLFSVLAPINQIVDRKFLIAYMRSGKIVFQNGLYEVLFSPEDNTCRKYAVQPDSIESAAIYLETLVSSYPSPDAGLHLPVMISVLRMILHDANRFD